MSYLSAGCLAAVVLTGMAGGHALAQSSPPEATVGGCFDVIRPLGRSTIGAILLNRCTGDSWLLVRTDESGRQHFRAGSVTYRWQPIAVDKTETAYRLPPRPSTAAPQIPKPGTSKCFTFDGRQFCE
jgi:hypothetical protein